MSQSQPNVKFRLDKATQTYQQPKRIKIDNDSSADTFYAALGLMKSSEKKKFLRKIKQLDTFNPGTRDDRPKREEISEEREKLLKAWQFCRETSDAIFEDHNNRKCCRI